MKRRSLRSIPVLAALLAGPAKAAELGRTGQRVVKENLGAVGRTVDMILEHLADDDIYVRPMP